MMPLNYDDEYPTCKATYVTLRILKDDLVVEDVTNRLGISPSESQMKGQERSQKRVAETGGWFLCSKGIVNSKDTRRHLDWLIEQLMPKQKELQDMQTEGFVMDVPCYWLSSSGQGGPTLSPSTMKSLGELGLELWFDVYLG